MCDHFHAKYVKIKKIKEKLSMLPTGSIETHRNSALKFTVVWGFA